MSTSKQSITNLHQSDLYLYFYEEDLTEERTKTECTFLEKKCRLQADDRVLDLACGHGRHANYLAGRGYKVTGLDINKKFIEIAQQSAKEKKVSVDYQIQDILEMDFKEEFETALLLFNSFGFFDQKDGERLLQKVFNALVKGGKAFIDTKNRDHIIKELRPCILTEKNKDLMIDRLTFNPIAGTTTNSRIYIKDGRRYDVTFTMHAYNYAQLVQMAESCGFSVKKVHGSWKGDPFDQDSRRIMLLLEK